MNLCFKYKFVNILLNDKIMKKEKEDYLNNPGVRMPYFIAC